MGWKRPSLRRKSGLAGRRFNKGRALSDRRIGFEVLEDRRMLSTIVWANRNSPNNSFDDAFDYVGGSFAEQAKSVIDVAIADWERVITSFNYTNPNQVFTVNISMAESSLAHVMGRTFEAGRTFAAGVHGDTPSGANIEIDWTSWLNPDGTIPAGTAPNVAAGYYLDPDPHDLSDFEGIRTGVGIDSNDITNAFVGGSNVNYASLADKRYDLYNLVEHELGHALGLYQSVQMLAAAKPTFKPDLQNVDSDGNHVGSLWTLDTAHAHVLLTSAGGHGDQNGPEHFADAGAFYSKDGVDYYGATSLMNASTSTEHKLIDDNDALVLQDIYGYSIQLPSSIATFYTTLDTDGTLRIDLRSLDLYNSSDTVALSSNNGTLQVVLELDQPVPGIDPAELVFHFNVSDVKKIDIKMGVGDDTILLSSLLSPLNTPIPIYINENANQGDDLLRIDGSTGHDVFEVDAPTIRSTGIFVASYGQIERLQFFTKGGSADIYAPNTATVTDFQVFGADTGEIIDLHSLDVHTSATINGGDGDDVIFLGPDATSGFGSIQARVTVNGKGGTDRLHVGMGNLDGFPRNLVDAAVTFDGGAGDDTVYFDDYLYGDAAKWIVGPKKVFRLTQTLLEVDYDATEAVTINTGLGGTDGNTVLVNGSFTSALTVNGGSGSDSVVLTNFENRFEENFDIVTYAAKFDLGGGLNFLSVDETAGLLTTFSLYATQLTYTNFFAAGDACLDFANISGGVTINASDDSNSVYIYGVPATADGFQHTILTNGGEDQFFLYPHDSAGNLTINGNLGLGGGADDDSVTIDDSGSLNGIDYDFENFFGAGTTNVDGLGDAGIGVGGDVEQLEVLAGDAADTFLIENYHTTTTALSIKAGGGADTLRITPTSKQIDTDLSSSAGYSFDGGEGDDAFSVDNNNSPNAWIYSRNADELNLFRVSGGYDLTFDATSFETWTLSGGTQADSFYLRNQPSGETMTFNGAGGLDNLYLGFTGSSVKDIGGLVNFDGNADGGTVTIYNAADSVGSTVHIGNDGADGTLGAQSGDNLFGAGGSLRFRNLANASDGFGINLYLGDGPDTIYAVPQASAAIRVEASEPSTSPGDTLNLSVNQAQNAVTQSAGVGSGKFTSTNFQPITWTGIENLGSNVLVLHSATTGQEFTLTSPAGTSITGTAVATPGVTPPLGVQFPFGYVNFTIQGVAAGAAADVIISGLNPTLVPDYYKYGATPTNSANHWYDFLYGQQTDADSAASTGMEIVGGNIVLHLVDGGRGDDDVAQNGTIVDVGGPAVAKRTQTVLTSDHVAGSIYGRLIHFTVIVSAAQGTPTGTVQFTIDGANVGTPQALLSGRASLDTSALSAIDHVITALYSSNSNSFADSGDDFTQHVARASLTIKADDKTKAFGAVIPPLTFKGVGFVNGDTAASLTTQPLLSTTANAGSSPGQYPITASGAVSPNYAISYAAGTLTVLAAAPVAGDDSVTTSKNAAVKINVLSNDSDLGGTIDVKTVVIVAKPIHGKLSVDSKTGVVTYNPTKNYIGPDSFTYKVKNTIGAYSNVATVNLTVSTPNNPPFAGNFLTTTGKNTPTLVDVLSTAKDTDGTIDRTSVVIVGAATHGTTSVNPTSGAVTYTPTTNFTGKDTFTYKVKDNRGAYSNVASVVVTVTLPNQAPQASNDSATTKKNKSVAVKVLANDSDSDGSINKATLLIVAGPQHGTLKVDSKTGVVTYTPAKNYTGPDSFTYQVKDDLGVFSNIATVNLTVSS